MANRILAALSATAVLGLLAPLVLSTKAPPPDETPLLEYTDPVAWGGAAEATLSATFQGLVPGAVVTNDYALAGLTFSDGNDTASASPIFQQDGEGLDGNGSVTIDFAVPTLAVGVHFAGGLQIEVLSGTFSLGKSSQFGGSGTGSFAGVSSSVPFDRVVLSDWGDDSAEIDDVLWGGSVAPLRADVDQVSLTAAGAQTFSLYAGQEHAGRTFLLLGSASGTEPGIPLDGHTLPLAVDAYTFQTLLQPNSPPVANNLGVLDAVGSATASFTVPPGLSLVWAGLVVHHAYAVLDLQPTSLSVALTSNAVALTLVP